MWRRVAFLAVPAVLVAAALGGTAADASAKGPAPHLVPLLRASCSATRSRSDPLRRPVRARRRAGRRREAGPRGAARRRAAAGRRLLGHERPGGGRRRARPRQDEREHALRRRERAGSTPSTCAARRRGCSTRSGSTHAWSHELLLHGDRLLVLSRGGYWVEPLPGDRRADRAVPARRRSVLAEVDVSDPSGLRLVRTLTLDGPTSPRGSSAAARASSRRRRSRRRCRSCSRRADDRGARGRARSATAPCSPRRASRAGCPPYRIKRAGAKPGRERSLVQCRHVRRPAAFSGLGLLTVLTVDLAKGLAAGRLGRRDDRRPHRLRLAREPLRRHRALGRPARSRPADRRSERRQRPRSTSSTSRARRGRSTAAAARCPATCSASGRSPSTAACCASSAPRARPGGAPAAARASRS